MLPVLQMCDGDMAIDLDANQSLYGEPAFVDVDHLKKPGYEGLLVQEEVTIDGTTGQEGASPPASPLRSESPSQTQVIMEPQGQQQQHDSDCYSNSTSDNLIIEEPVLDDQIVEIELDKEADELISQLSDNDASERVYTEMEPVQQGEFTTLLMEEEDSGLGSSGQVSPSSATSYPSLSSMEQSESTDLMSWTTKHPDNWSNTEVLDWIYSLADQPNTHIDSTQLRGEVSYIPYYYV